MGEQEFVVQQFQKAFAKWQGECFVLYGLGKNTKAILRHTEGFQFAGLMDANNTGNEFWGLKVLDEEEVLALRPKIVIIAREPVVPVIYARIAYLQEEHGLQIYNFKGELQGQGADTYANQGLPYWDVTEEGLKREILTHDCISFDIFDTLLMRRVLEPPDVFWIVEQRLEQMGHTGNQFRLHRIHAEQSLAGYPALPQIYGELGRRYGIPEGVLTEWMELEIQTESRVIVPRRSVVGLLEFALGHGKKVFLLSDMYFPKRILENFLTMNGIRGYSGLLVSCDCQKSKADGGLFQMYKQETQGGSYLHIGDNRRSDGEEARKQGLDTFLVYSAYEMWMASSMQGTLSHVRTLGQRCILGNLVWHCCENPFAFHLGKGVLTVSSLEEMGYIFLGALYDEFTMWLLRKLREEGIEQLLLPARDGFLVEKLLLGANSTGQPENLFEAVYFKASRRAVSVPAIKSKEDILLLAERGFQGTFGELLLQRYGVRPKAGDPKKNCSLNGQGTEAIQEYVLSYLEEILRHAKKERVEYLDYLDSLQLLGGKKQAIFDFVAGGTVQYFMQKLLGREQKGFYFATMGHPNRKYQLENSISSAYGNIQPYALGNNVARHYLFLETVMVDGYPTFTCIKDGKFLYGQENSQTAGNGSCISGKENSSHFQAVQKVQEGVLRYQKDMQRLRELSGGQWDEREFADMLFGKLFDGSCQVVQGIGQEFYNDDAFDGVKPYSVWNGSEG